MTATVLLLDVMETLVTEPFFTTVPRFFGLSLEELLRVKDPRSWIEFEHGRIDERTYVEQFFADRRAVDLEPLKAWMKDTYEWLDGTEALLAELKGHGVPMHAVSNYSRWFELIEEKLGVSRYVEWTFVSCLTGHRKPDPEAYLVACRTLGLPPSAFVFVDDRAVNVEAAIALGMRGVVRDPRDTPRLRRDLVALGVLPAEHR
ncbi:HAD-IA family hydrolase [Myxococcota bacterium]|nr:HAD-IA family hydrolase [Myxococcota bacterium]